MKSVSHACRPWPSKICVKSPEGNQMMWEHSIHNNQQHMLIVGIKWTKSQQKRAIRIIRKTSSTTITTRTPTIKCSFIFNEFVQLLLWDRRERVTHSHVHKKKERLEYVFDTAYFKRVCVLPLFFLAHNHLKQNESDKQNHSIGCFFFSKIKTCYQKAVHQTNRLNNVSFTLGISLHAHCTYMELRPVATHL